MELSLPFVFDEVTLFPAPMLLRTDEGDLDCFTGVKGVGTYDHVVGSSEPVSVGDLQFRAKRAAGRPKDQEALLELEALASLGRP